LGRIGVAVVGAGAWGKNIVRALKELETEGLVEVEAVVDADEGRARSVAEEFSIPTYSTDVLEVPSKGVPAAVVAVSIDQLTAVSKVLIERGVHVFVEKPVSTRSTDILELIELAKASGVITQPGFIVRFDPVSKKLKEFLSLYGQVKYVIFRRLSRRPKHRQRFPIVFDLMVHDIDLTQYLLGRREWRVLSVNAIEFTEAATHTLEVLIKYGKTLITYIADGLLPVKVREVDVATDRAYIRGNFKTRKVVVETPQGMSSHEARGEEPLKEELRAFIMRVRGFNVREAPTLEDAYEAVRIAEVIFRLEKH